MWEQWWRFSQFSISNIREPRVALTPRQPSLLPRWPLCVHQKGPKCYKVQCRSCCWCVCVQMTLYLFQDWLKSGDESLTAPTESTKPCWFWFHGCVFTGRTHRLVLFSFDAQLSVGPEWAILSCPVSISLWHLVGGVLPVLPCPSASLTTTRSPWHYTSDNLRILCFWDCQTLQQHCHYTTISTCKVGS